MDCSDHFTTCTKSCHINHGTKSCHISETSITCALVISHYMGSKNRRKVKPWPQGGGWVFKDEVTHGTRISYGQWGNLLTRMRVFSWSQIWSPPLFSVFWLTLGGWPSFYIPEWSLFYFGMPSTVLSCPKVKASSQPKVVCCQHNGYTL